MFGATIRPTEAIWVEELHSLFGNAAKRGNLDIRVQHPTDFQSPVYRRTSVKKSSARKTALENLQYRLESRIWAQCFITKASHVELRNIVSNL